MGQLTYEIHRPDNQNKHQVFHVKMLKRYYERPEPTVSGILIQVVEEEEDYNKQYLPGYKEECMLDESSARESSTRALQHPA